MSQIKIKEYSQNDTDVWQIIYKNASTSTFLLSLEWIQFQKLYGKTVKQFIIEMDGKPVGIFYVENWRRRISKYAYCPRGPIILDEYRNNESKFKEILSELKNFGKKYISENNLNAFRIDPLWDISKQKEMKNKGWIESFTLGQVKNTWIMNLEKDKEELFQLQKKDTRYYIRRAEKMGVEIIRAESQEQVDEFNKLMKETKERNNFHGFGPDYYTLQWNTLNVNGKQKLTDLSESLCEIFLAKFEGKYIGGALINFSNQMAHYAHGASTSDPELSKLASPYLILWKAIEYTKERGKNYFDFWGVIPKGVAHEWRGLSDFKMKFEGEFVQYTGIFEVYANFPKYQFNRIIDWWNYRKLRF